MSDHNNSEPIPHAPMTAINTERAIAEAAKNVMFELNGC